MSEGSVDEDNPTFALCTGMDVNKIGHDCDLKDDDAALLLADSSSLVQAHAVSDPIFAPVRKLPPEILANIFIECIPSLIHERRSYFDEDIFPQQVRARLGRVCRIWNAVLTDEPGVWATLDFFDNWLPALEIVSLWIKRSKSHPLDVSLQINGRYGFMGREAAAAFVKMLHRELWRIRSFTADCMDYYETSWLFPPDSLSEAPMMELLSLNLHKFVPKGRLGRLGCIRCPQLRTLDLWNCDKAVESLISKPMPNLRSLYYGNDDTMLGIKLLQVLPNLVELSWYHTELPLPDEIPRVALPSLKSLTVFNSHWEITIRFLRHLDVPSLEKLILGDCGSVNDHQGSSNMVLDVICGDGAVQLRHLILDNSSLRRANFHAMWHHFKHLETLVIRDPRDVSGDELLITLSPPNRDFTFVCPELKTLELSYMMISMGALVGFVQRRVKSDLGDPAPGLVTCLTLLNMCVDKEMSAQLAKTHSLSVHLCRCCH